MASAAFEPGKVGAAAERTQASFATMAAGVGSSGDEMLAAMQQATAGTVSNSGFDAGSEPGDHAGRG